MHPDCIKEIGAAVGHELSKAEQSKYEAAIIAHGRRLARENPDEWRGFSQVQRIMRAAEQAKLEALGKAEKAAERKAANLVAQAREVHQLTRRAPAMRGDKKFHTALFERMRQIENYINGVKHEAVGSVMDTIYAVEPRFFKLIENPIAVSDFAREVYGQHTGNPIAKNAAKGYLDAVEGLRVRQNAAGADIGKLSYGYLPQPHDVGRIARAGKQKWRDDIEPLLNRNRYVNDDGSTMTDAEFRAKVEAAYDSLSTEGRNAMVPSAQEGRSALAARKDDEHRILHFKNADSHLAYLQDYGRGGMLEAITGHIAQTGRTIGLLESFGPNPNATYRLLKDSAEKYDNLAGGRESLATLDMVWDTLSGVTAQPVSASLAAGFQKVREFVVATKLQSVMISSITDVATMNVAAKYNGMPTGESLRNTIGSFGTDTKVAATRLGLATESITTEMSQWHADNLAQGWTNKLANTTMRLTLVEAWTHALRRGFGLTLSATLGKLRNTDWHALSAFDHERFTAAGIRERDWRVWQLAELTELNGEQLLTKDGIRAIHPQRMRDLGMDPVADINASIAKLLGFIDQEAHMAVLSPDLMTRAAITQGTRTGTWGGEMLRNLMLFKSFPMAMAVKHVRRIQSLPDNTARVIYSTRLLTGLTFWGALALQLHQMKDGKDPRDMTQPKFWSAAFTQGGGFGIFGDILYTGMKGNARGGQSNWTSLMGPVFGTAAGAADVTFGNLGEALQGHKTHAGAEIVRFVRGNTPLVNLWYARAAIDHLFMHDLQESVSPGYLRKMRKRAHDDFDQDFWWTPGDKLPERGPDLEAATGG